MPQEEAAVLCISLRGGENFYLKTAHGSPVSTALAFYNALDAERDLAGTFVDVFHRANENWLLATSDDYSNTAVYKYHLNGGLMALRFCEMAHAPEVIFEGQLVDFVRAYLSQDQYPLYCVHGGAMTMRRIKAALLETVGRAESYHRKGMAALALDAVRQTENIMVALTAQGATLPESLLTYYHEVKRRIRKAA